MKWHIFSDYEDLSRQLAADIFDLIQIAPSLDIGISTGHSPALTYELIGHQLDTAPEQRSKITAVQLDEWVGCGFLDSASCYRDMKTKVVDPWKLDHSQVISINGEQPHEELTKIIKYYNQHNLNLCISGLGRNGHLALNEPGSQKEDGCRIVDLADTSQDHKMLADRSSKPNQGITLGIKEILASDRIILIVTGEEKQEAFAAFEKGVIIDEYPVTYLHLHDNVHCYVDESSLT